MDFWIASTTINLGVQIHVQVPWKKDAKRQKLCALGEMMSMCLYHDPVWRADILFKATYNQA